MVLAQRSSHAMQLAERIDLAGGSIMAHKPRLRTVWHWGLLCWILLLAVMPVAAQPPFSAST